VRPRGAAVWAHVRQDRRAALGQVGRQRDRALRAARDRSSRPRARVQPLQRSARTARRDQHGTLAARQVPSSRCFGGARARLEAYRQQGVT